MASAQTLGDGESAASPYSLPGLGLPPIYYGEDYAFRGVAPMYTGNARSSHSRS